MGTALACEHQYREPCAFLDVDRPKLFAFSAVSLDRVTALKQSQ